MGLRPTTDGQIIALTATLHAPGEAMLRAVLKLAELAKQLGSDGNGHLRRCRRSWRAQVAGMIDQRRVRFMPDRRDQGNRGFGGRTDDLLLVERPEILD